MAEMPVGFTIVTVTQSRVDDKFLATEISTARSNWETASNFSMALAYSLRKSENPLLGILHSAKTVERDE
jgi:hypothetical protein